MKVKALTKDQIAQDAILKLMARLARVRKVHNVGYYRGRRNQVQRGWSDIQGYSVSGQAILCEVKTKNDEFSKDQIERLQDLHNCGGVALVACQINYQVEILSWGDAKKVFKITD
jgi:hypothetical protein